MFEFMLGWTARGAADKASDAIDDAIDNTVGRAARALERTRQQVGDLVSYDSHDDAHPVLRPGFSAIAKLTDDAQDERVRRCERHGHSMGSWQSYRSAESGRYKARSCGRCGHTETEGGSW